MKNDRKVFIKNIAKDAIDIYIKKAEKVYTIDKKLAHRYVSLAWKMVKKYKIGLTEGQKQKFCRKCQSLWVIEDTIKIGFNHKLNAFQIICNKCSYKKVIKKEK